MDSPLDDPRLVRARTLARILDSAVRVPGLPMRVGLDPVLGLVPGLGDLAGAALSGYIVLTGIRLGAPRAVVVRMLGNVALDTLVGTVPLLGDLFDAGWKANVRNVALIDRHARHPGETRRASGWMIVGGITALLLLAAAGTAAAVFTIRALLGLFPG